MLTFRRTNYFLFACLLILNVSHFFTTVSGWWYGGLGMLYFFIIGIGSSRVNSHFHFKVICKGEKPENGVVLSFDDGPDSENTPLLLDALKNHQIKAAFFLIGKKAAHLPELVKRMADEGHVLGNHTYGHSYFFDFFSPRGMMKELERCRDVIAGISGNKVNWFRPPYGVTNPMMRMALKRTGFVPIGWSIRSLDTVIKNRNRLSGRLSKTKPGDIVLFHDSTCGIHEIVEEFITVLKNKGIDISEPERLIGVKAYL